MAVYGRCQYLNAGSGALAWDGSGVGRLQCGGPATLARAIHLDFLGGSRFGREIPDSDYWISLDFLGFSRPNLDFSMGYMDKSVELFFSALSVT
jgi:hypothetical protein